MSDELKINISTPANTAGAKETSKELQNVAAASNQVTNAAKKQGEATKEAGKELLSMGETSEKGIGIGMMFARVAEGDALALLNLTSALKVTGAALKTNLIGMAVLAVTALGSFLNNLRNTSKAAEETSKDIQDSFGRAKTGIEKFNEVRLDKLKSEIDEVGQAAQAMDAIGKRFDAMQARLANARMNLELARIEDNEFLTPDEKAERSFKVRERNARDLARIEDQGRDRGVDIAREKMERSGNAANKAEAAAAQQKQVVEAARGVPDGLLRLTRELDKILESISAQRGGLRQQEGADATMRDVALAQAQKSIQGQRDYLQARLDASQSVGSQVAGGEQTRQLTALEAAARDARAKARQAEAEYQATAEAAGQDQFSSVAARGLERQTRRIQAGYFEQEATPYDRSKRVESFAPAQGRVYDAASLRETSEKYGKMTGAQIAEEMERAIKANNAAILQEFREQIKNIVPR